MSAFKYKRKRATVLTALNQLQALRYRDEFVHVLPGSDLAALESGLSLRGIRYENVNDNTCVKLVDEQHELIRKLREPVRLHLGARETVRGSRGAPEGMLYDVQAVLALDSVRVFALEPRLYLDNETVKLIEFATTGFGTMSLLTYACLNSPWRVQAAKVSNEIIPVWELRAPADTAHGDLARRIHDVLNAPRYAFRLNCRGFRIPDGVVRA